MIIIMILYNKNLKPLYISKLYYYLEKGKMKQSKIYLRGYGCGYQRAMRELNGQTPNKVHRSHVSKSKSYQKGLMDGYETRMKKEREE